MRFFITGGAGFIGSHLVDHLLGNATSSVTVYDNFVTGRREFLEEHQEDPRLRIVEGDVLDLDSLSAAMAGHEHVYHLSANADISRGVSETDLDLKQTVLATYNVLEGMRRQGVRRIVYSSGSGVYGDVGTVETAEHFGPLLPISLYGATKLGAEGLVSAFSHMFGMTAWIFRFANVVGGRQTHGVGFDFIRKLRNDPTALEILGDGQQSKSYIHVTDIIAAIDYVIDASVGPVAVFNVATGDYITVDEIAEIVASEMRLANVQIRRTGGTRGWLGDVPLVRFNTDKILSLGWKPRYRSAEAVRAAVKAMLETGV